MSQFKPASMGCMNICPVWNSERDICCSCGRKCCFFCFEGMCPIKEAHKIEIILKEMIE